METGTILVVDDDVDIAANFIDILTDQGYQADAANDGASALELVRERKYDLALLDFQMSDMDGATLFEEIRAVRPDLRAIMITAFAGSSGIERAAEAGVDQVLRKPVDMRQFFLALNGLPDRKRSNPDSEHA
jgi:CheY-like chemotaxis protein